MSESERGIRAKLRRSSKDEHPGHGAGSGDTERYEYECPCGRGSVIEEHDNIPGFREHDVHLDCAYCKEEGWEVVYGQSARDWRLEKAGAPEAEEALPPELPPNISG